MKKHLAKELSRKQRETERHLIGHEEFEALVRVSRAEIGDTYDALEPGGFCMWEFGFGRVMSNVYVT